MHFDTCRCNSLICCGDGDGGSDSNGGGGVSNGGDDGGGSGSGETPNSASRIRLMAKIQ